MYTILDEVDGMIKGALCLSVEVLQGLKLWLIQSHAINIFSWVTKNSGLVTTLATRFLCDLDLN